MKRICIGLLTALGCIAVATALIVRPFSKKSIQSYVLRNQDELTNYARKVIEEHPMGPLEWNGWKVYYYADDMVDFVQALSGSFRVLHIRAFTILKMMNHMAFKMFRLSL